MHHNLKYIVDLLMLYGSFSVEPGLCNGKMGIAISLYHYSRFSRNEIYANFADELLDLIFDEIGETNPTCFQTGMTGIGWGIEYLVQNNFVEANTDDIFSELDEKIFSNSDNYLYDSFKEDAYFGQGLYFLMRIKDREYRNKNSIVQNIKEKLIIYTNICEDYLNTFNKISEKPKYFNLRYHLSIFYFLLEMKRLKLFEIKVEKLIKANYRILLENIKEFKSVSDQSLLNVLLNKLNILSGHLKTHCLNISVNEIKSDQIIEFPFLNLIYDVNITGEAYRKNIQIADTDIQKLINNKKEVGKNRNLGLQNGLAGLGMTLMELKSL